MFLESSRYHKVAQTNVITKDRQTVKAIKLRRLPAVSDTNNIVVKQHDRLDIIAQHNFDNSTQFWRIADANTELQANDLVKDPGHIIEIPGS